MATWMPSLVNRLGSSNYFQNTGSATSPAFIERSGTLNPFNGVDVGKFSTPALPTWMAMATWMLFSGEFNGTILYYKNTSLFPLLSLPVVLR